MCKSIANVSQICTSANVKADVLQICIVAKMNWHWLPISTTKFELSANLFFCPMEYLMFLVDSDQDCYDEMAKHFLEQGFFNCKLGKGLVRN